MVRDVPGARGAANVDERADVVKADLRGLRQHCKRSAVGRPCDPFSATSFNVGHHHAPPEPSASNDIKAGRLGFDHVVYIGERIGKPRVSQDGIVRAIGRDQCAVDASRQRGERNGSSRRGGRSVGLAQAAASPVAPACSPSACRTGLCRRAVKPDGLEVLRNSQMSERRRRKPESSATPCCPGLLPAEADAVENAFAVGRNRDRRRAAAGWQHRRR